MVGRCDSVEVRERDYDKKGPGSIASSGSDSGLRFSSYLIETLQKTGQTFSPCLQKLQRAFKKGTTAVASPTSFLSFLPFLKQNVFPLETSLEAVFCFFLKPFYEV